MPRYKITFRIKDTLFAEKLLIKKEMSHKDLQAQTGLSSGLISRVLNEAYLKPVSIKTAIKIANALDVEVDDIFIEVVKNQKEMK